MQFTLNGATITAEPPPGSSLLELLRESCGLVSPKDGCAPEGSCGACTVLIDGRPAVSCAQPATRVAGHEVVTLEGLPAGTRQAWADAFVRTGATQCGYCTPGIVMKAEGLLTRNPDPAGAEVARALAGNLCRCTGYASIVRAIREVAAARRGQLPAACDAQAAGDRVGDPAPRYRGREQVLGERPFVGDMRIPGMLHAAVRLADHPRARVLRIDTSEAERAPGVVRVVTWRDVPGERVQGQLVADWPVFVAAGTRTQGSRLRPTWWATPSPPSGSSTRSSSRRRRWRCRWRRTATRPACVSTLRARAPGMIVGSSPPFSGCPRRRCG
jgi:xanthine dehydrogenase molybdenum-binding subunit